MNRQNKIEPDSKKNPEYIESDIHELIYHEPSNAMFNNLKADERAKMEEGTTEHTQILSKYVLENCKLGAE